MFWSIFLLIIALGGLFFTIKHTLRGFFKEPEKKWWRILTNDGWAFSLIFAVMYLGKISRGEISPLPWEAFIQSFDTEGLFSNQGLLYSIYASIWVFVADLWAFWTASHCYLKSKEGNYIVKKLDQSRGIWTDITTTREPPNGIFIRLFNMALGLLLMTPGNPLYKLMEIMAQGSYY